MTARIFSLLVMAFPVLAFAQAQPSAEAEQMFSKMTSQINPRHVQWIRSTAREINSANQGPEEVMAKSRNYAVLGSMSGQDIEAIAFLVMMQAAKSAQEDLKAIMAKVKAINNQKAGIRNAMARLNGQRLISSSQLDSFKLIHSRTVSIQRGANPETLVFQRSKDASRQVTKSEMDAMRNQLEKDFDSMSEMGEMETLKLQMMMDRMSAFETSLSNLLAKISKTAASIIQNLK